MALRCSLRLTVWGPLESGSCNIVKAFRCGTRLLNTGVIENHPSYGFGSSLWQWLLHVLQSQCMQHLSRTECFLTLHWSSYITDAEGCRRWQAHRKICSRQQSSAKQLPNTCNSKALSNTESCCYGREQGLDCKCTPSDPKAESCCRNSLPVLPVVQDLDCLVL